MRKKITGFSIWFLSLLLWIRVVTVQSADDSITVKMMRQTPADSMAAADEFSQHTTIRTTQASLHSSACTSINTAAQKELVALPGIGPVIAQRIIEYRTKNGPFSHIDEIDHVKGIGPATLRKLEGLLCL